MRFGSSTGISVGSLIGGMLALIGAAGKGLVQRFLKVSQTLGPETPSSGGMECFQED